MAGILPNQAFPDQLPWVDMSDLLVNGWSVTGLTQYVIAKADGNDAKLNGSLVIGGEGRTALTISLGYRPQTTQNIMGFITGHGPTTLQLQRGGVLLIPTYAWPGDQVIGQVITFAHTYPRKAN